MLLSPQPPRSSSTRARYDITFIATSECDGPLHRQVLTARWLTIQVLKDETTLKDNGVSENGFLVVMVTKVSTATHRAPSFLSCD